jgi:hypothetical protein
MRPPIEFHWVVRMAALKASSFLSSVVFPSGLYHTAQRLVSSEGDYCCQHSCGLERNGGQKEGNIIVRRRRRGKQSMRLVLIALV